MKTRASFKSMKEADAQDMRAIDRSDMAHGQRLPEILLAELEKLKAGEPAMNISRYQHSLQSATLAYRDGAEEELVVAALLHDIGDSLAVFNHADIAAAILKPYVSEKTHWIIQKHALFQTYYFAQFYPGQDPNARDKYIDHPWYQACVDFCEKYDQNAFDDEYDTLPLEFFKPMVKRVFSHPPFEGNSLGNIA